MKITPIEIRQHSFEKGLRGYRTEEVEAFLNSLSQEWERIISENKMLKMQLELAEKELNKLKEVELILFKTLKTAEDTSSQITEQASRAAEQYMGESKQKADEIMAEARKKSVLLVQDAENQSRYIKENILNDLKSIESDFKAMERYKENLMVQIQTLANNALESVDRFEKKFNRQSVRTKIDEVASQIEADKAAETGAHLLPADAEMPEAEAETPDTAVAETVSAEPEEIAPVESEVTPEATEVVAEVAAEPAQPAEASADESPAEVQADVSDPVDQPLVTAGAEEEHATADMSTSAGPPPSEAKKSGGSFFDQI